jgi:hypothetical protein
MSATGHRAEGTGELGATGGLDRPYASDLERPAARKTAPPSSRSSPRSPGARRCLRGAASRPGPEGGGAPRLPALWAQPLPPSAYRRAVLSYGGGIAATPAAAHSRPASAHPPSRDTRTARAPTDARPRHPRPPTYPYPSPASTPKPPSRRLDGSPPRLSDTHLLVPHLPCLRTRLPPPRLRPLQLPAWAGPPRFTWRVEEGSPRRKQRTPFLESPRGKRKTARGRGGGLFACKGEQLETNN